MANSYDAIATQPLIFELLFGATGSIPSGSRRSRDPSEGVKAGTLAEAALIHGALSPSRKSREIYGEDLFLPIISSNVEAGAVDKEIGGVLPRSSASNGSDQGVRDDASTSLFVSPEEMGSSTSSSS